MGLKPGTRLYSTACDTEVVVVRAPAGDVDLRCCTALLRERRGTADGAPTSDATGEHTQLGKRYVDDAAGVELLCTKAGPGPLTCDGRPMGIKAPKALPASD